MAKMIQEIEEDYNDVLQVLRSHDQRNGAAKRKTYDSLNEIIKKKSRIQKCDIDEILQRDATGAKANAPSGTRQLKQGKDNEMKCMPTEAAVCSNLHLSHTLSPSQPNHPFSPFYTAPELIEPLTAPLLDANQILIPNPIPNSDSAPAPVAPVAVLVAPVATSVANLAPAVAPDPVFATSTSDCFPSNPVPNTDSYISTSTFASNTGFGKATITNIPEPLISASIQPKSAPQHPPPPGEDYIPLKISLPASIASDSLQVISTAKDAHFTTNIQGNCGSSVVSSSTPWAIGTEVAKSANDQPITGKPAVETTTKAATVPTATVAATVAATVPTATVAATGTVATAATGTVATAATGTTATAATGTVATAATGTVATAATGTVATAATVVMEEAASVVAVSGDTKVVTPSQDHFVIPSSSISYSMTTPWDAISAASKNTEAKAAIPASPAPSLSSLESLLAPSLASSLAHSVTNSLTQSLGPSALPATGVYPLQHYNLSSFNSFSVYGGNQMLSRRRIGKLIYWNAQKKCGTIVEDSQKYFAHITNITMPVDATPIIMQHVSFDVSPIREGRNPRAINITSCDGGEISTLKTVASNLSTDLSHDAAYMEYWNKYAMQQSMQSAQSMQTMQAMQTMQMQGYANQYAYQNNNNYSYYGYPYAYETLSSAGYPFASDASATFAALDASATASTTVSAALASAPSGGTEAASTNYRALVYGYSGAPTLATKKN